LLRAERLLNVDTGETPQATVIRLRQALANGTEFQRSDALARLAESALPSRAHDLQAVLENPHEIAGLRALAALYLGRSRVPEALDILIENSRTQTGGVLARIVDALGRIGDGRALAAVQDVVRRTSPPVSSRALFAATLIVHRLALTGEGLPALETVSYLDADKHRLVDLSIRPADARLISDVLSRLSTHYEIGLAERPAYRISCDRREEFLVLTRESVRRDVVERLTRVRTVLAVVCTPDVEIDSYAVTGLVLTAPAGRESVDMRVYRPNGHPLLGTTGQIRGSLLHFRLAAVARAAARPFDIVGSLGPAGLTIVAARAAPHMLTKLHANEGLGSGADAPDEPVAN
jgi:hypothetical protein